MRELAHNHLEITHFGLFVGLGGIARGMQDASASITGPNGQPLNARMRCVGGVDVDPAACRDYERIVGTPAACLDLFDREDYVAFHGQEPPPDWREATPADILAAAGGEHPDIAALSAPCKGFSGLLNKKSARSRKYQALNRLTLRSIVLLMEAFKAQPPKLIVFENVPRIATVGRQLLDAIVGILESYGYAVAETVHDCGELGGLAQHRKRYLLVARHRAQVRPFLYEPPKRRVKAVGEVLGPLPLPDDPAAGPMHRTPRLQWKTWVRLALIEAGKDWRSLQDLEVNADGYLTQLGIVPLKARWFPGVLGVTPWDGTSPTVTSRANPTTGRFSVADPRSTTSHGGAGKYRVTGMDEPAGTVIAASTTGQGAAAIADPRAPRDLGRYEPYGVTAWDEASGTVTSKAAPGSGHFSVADPRLDCDVNDRQGRRHCNVYRVIRWDETSTCVTGANGNARPNVQDPRPTWNKSTTGNWSTSGHYGVVGWDDTAGTVTGASKHDQGAWTVADRRLPSPESRPTTTPMIIALDGTVHRPFTTLELAVLQGFSLTDVLGMPLDLDGNNDSHKRMRIGNAVPPKAAAAMGSVMAHTLLLQWAEVGFFLSAAPIWCRPLVTALSVDIPSA